MVKVSGKDQFEYGLLNEKTPLSLQGQSLLHEAQDLIMTVRY